MRANIKFASLLFVGILALAVPAYAAMWQWSTTAGNNATADPTINWAEGMSPSSVNDSARAMMARTAEWRDDTSGLLADSGTASAYVVTTEEGLSATPNDGQKICFTPANTNAVGVTLAADSGTAFAIDTTPGTGVPSGAMVAGTPYCVKFKSASSVWVLHGFFASTTNIPLGAVVDYTGTSAPNSNFVLAFGQCISRTTYAAYFSLVSTTFGVCDGVTTFGVPDLRGYVIAGIDNMGGSAANRITSGGSGISGTTLGAAGGLQTATVAQANLPNVNFTVSGITLNDPGHTHGFLGTPNGGVTTTSAPFGTGGGTDHPSANPVVSATTGITISNQGSAASGGSGTPLVNVQPTIMLNKIIRIF